MNLIFVDQKANLGLMECLDRMVPLDSLAKMVPLDNQGKMVLLARMVMMAHLAKTVHLVKKEIKDLRVLREKMQTYGSLRLLPTDSICFSRIKKEKKQRSIPLKVQKVILEEKDREV